MTLVDRLIDTLAVVDENILTEAVEQPTLFIKAGRYRVIKMRKRAQAEARLEQYDAFKSLRLRARTEERLPLEYFKQRLERDPKHKMLRARKERAEEAEEFSKLLLEAYRMRRDGIKIIADHEFREGSRETAGVERDAFDRKLRAKVRRLEEKRRRVK